jgi:predicted TPR repeat methyltransferase
VPQGRDRLSWIYSATGNEDLAKRYDTWAEEYDDDVLRFGYKIPALIAGLTGRYQLAGEQPVLDAGAGTGIIGEIHAELRYINVHALDLSAGMLAVAERKGVYAGLRQMALGEHLDYTDGQFACVIASGVLSLGHAPPESLDEMTRVTQSGGSVIFSVRVDAYVEQGFKAKMDELESAGRWTATEKTQPFMTLPLAEPDLKHQVFAFKVS